MSNTTKNITRWFSYTPHIYNKKGDWNTHIGIFVAIQLVPLILTSLFGYSVLSVMTSIFYYILSGANIGILLLAVYENKKYAYQLKEVSVEERVGDQMISEVKPE
jgi:hypothetical protein